MDTINMLTKPLSDVKFRKQLMNAQVEISRLDERAKRHSALKDADREGWGAQRILRDACDAQWISGHLVDPLDLILHDSGAPSHLGDHHILSARQRIRKHTQLVRVAGLSLIHI